MNFGRGGEGSIRIRCFRNLLRGPLLTKEGDTERTFGGLNPIVLTQESGEKKSLSYLEKVYIEREEEPLDALTIFLFFFRIFASIWIIEPTNSE